MNVELLTIWQVTELLLLKNIFQRKRRGETITISACRFGGPHFRYHWARNFFLAFAPGFFNFWFSFFGLLGGYFQQLQRPESSLIRKMKSLSLGALGVWNRIIDDSDSKQFKFDNWFWSDLKSNDKMVSYHTDLFSKKFNLISIRINLIWIKRSKIAD